MTQSSLLYNRRGNRAPAIGHISLDVSINERHSVSSNVTQHPIEDGADINDHIIKMPRRIQITGLVTNSPIGDDDPSPTRAHDAFLELERLHEDRALVDVVTGLKIYANMALVTLDIPRGRGTGDAIEFTADLMQIRKVSSQTVDIPADILPSVETAGDNPGTNVDQGQSSQDAGKQAPEIPTETEEQSTSILYDLVIGD